MELRKFRHILPPLLIFLSSVFIFSCMSPVPQNEINEEPLIRVLIDRLPPYGKIEFKSKGTFTVIGGSLFGKAIENRIEIKANESGLVINDSPSETDTVEIYSSSTISYNGIEYPGIFRVVLTNGYIYLINVLPIEQYLECVVPSEMPATWSIEALKAQAITSRTYALYSIKNSKNILFDVYASYKSQVYKGLRNLHPKSTRAVIDTRGLVITHKDEIIPAFFHATSGGFIEDSSLLLNKSLPYLKPSVDNFSKFNYRSRWDTTISTREFSKIIFGSENITIKEIIIPYRLPSGSVKEVNIIGITKNGEEISNTISVHKLRELIPSILSPKFSVELKDKVIKFSGYGWGHGVGLSQWGSKEMAEQGYNYREIIKFYFKDTDITRLY